MNLGLLMETMFFFFFFSHIVLYFEIRENTFVIPSVYCMYCKNIVCFMGLIVRLQSDPQSLCVAP